MFLLTNLRTILLLLLIACHLSAQLQVCLYSDPKTFDPALVNESAGETIRYLTGGVLIRVNRSSQKAQPELAESWQILNGGRKVSFRLRQNVRFSDGTPFSAEDVAFTFRRIADPALRSPSGDAFRFSAGAMQVAVAGAHSVVLTFPEVVTSVERLIDQVAIQSSRSPLKERAVLGPFMLADYRPGSYVELRRNPHYWKKDGRGKQLPYLQTVRLDIQANRDLEALRLRRGEIHMAETLDAETWERLRSNPAVKAVNAGPTTDVEMIWFNQKPGAPIPPHKGEWFRSREFRRAISAAINRDDIVRIVYRGYAQAAAGPVPASSIWFNNKLKPQSWDATGARRSLEQAGFKYSGSQLLDRHGNPVVFSVVTNAGNKTRARIAALVQQDLARIGVQLNIVTLDFPSLIDRITRSFDYEACLLGLVNVDPDPNGQMNVWLSSASNHQWNPAQKSPATAWEAEIDKLMRLQAASVDPKQRKAAFDRVQEIAAHEVPFVYLVNRHALAAVSSSLRNASPVPFRPHLFWNIEQLMLQSANGGADVRAAAGR